MDDKLNSKALDTFYDGEVILVQYDDDFRDHLERFCKFADRMNYVNNNNPDNMKLDEVVYHCLIHAPSNKMYAVAGVQPVFDYKPGYYRIFTRLCRIPIKELRLNRNTTFMKRAIPEVNGLMFQNIKYASEQSDFTAAIATSLANKAYSSDLPDSSSNITDYAANIWWKKRNLLEPEGIYDFWMKPQVVWKFHHEKLLNNE